MADRMARPQVYILWDESASPKAHVGGYNVVAAIRTLATRLGVIKAFNYYVDISSNDKTRLLPVLASELQCSGVSVIDTVSGGRDGASSKMMIADCFLLALDNPDPLNIVLLVLTSDPHLCYSVASLRSRGYCIPVLCPLAANSNITHLSEGYAFDVGTDATLSDIADNVRVMLNVATEEVPSQAPVQQTLSSNIRPLEDDVPIRRTQPLLPDFPFAAAYRGDDDFNTLTTTSSTQPRLRATAAPFSPSSPLAASAFHAPNQTINEAVTVATSYVAPPTNPRPWTWNWCPETPPYPYFGLAKPWPAVPMFPPVISNNPTVTSARPGYPTSIPSHYHILVTVLREMRENGIYSIQRMSLAKPLLARQANVFVDAGTTHKKRPVRLYVSRAKKLGIVTIDKGGIVSLAPAWY
ncbi:hypothetical protein CC1G_03840 [Coprinopsis cinerea okayama7|uniref:Uncharacterized protein n=1 Tax=Coprinopsis cinerea (strain Okayama-7 / 130 / ATCC MYA-4618 / FGSC 9003) TaxID=240176 RepID=A8NGX5_COPC7|nr:hypothetical protein CC1G_03840 [Coprinopsis cinerea okayama7\|eukprot:XP_001833623.2 hypothetical protein CC1G_03840 [Coprinopsis cinerea okayama7\